MQQRISILLEFNKISLIFFIFQTVENSVLSTKTLLGCFSDKSRQYRNMHAWELFSAFYEMKVRFRIYEGIL